MSGLVKIKLWVPDQQAYRKVMGIGKLKLDCAAPKKDKEGSFMLTIYTDKATAKKVVASGYRYEMDEEFGERLKARQQEVSKTDRFEKGRIKPRGLGIKK